MDMGTAARTLVLGLSLLGRPALAQAAEPGSDGPRCLTALSLFSPEDLLDQILSERESGVRSRVKELKFTATVEAQKRWDYNIWDHNCHTAANEFVDAAADKARAGIVVCGGDPRVSPQHHTFNWVVSRGGETCLVNYGDRRCWKAAAVPPEIRSGEGRRYAQEFCGSQYNMRTRILCPGETVEYPGPHICAMALSGIAPSGSSWEKGPAALLYNEPKEFVRRVTASGQTPGPDGRARPSLPFCQDDMRECLECCNGRADMWECDPESPAEKKGDRCEKFWGAQKKFLYQCYHWCQALYMAWQYTALKCPAP